MSLAHQRDQSSLLNQYLCWAQGERGSGQGMESRKFVGLIRQAVSPSLAPSPRGGEEAVRRTVR